MVSESSINTHYNYIGCLRVGNDYNYEKITEYIVQLQVEVVMNWFNANLVTKHALATCLEQHVVS